MTTEKDDIGLEPWEAALRPDDREFVREYLIDLNAKQAAIRCAYYPSPQSAHKNAWRIMRRGVILKAIAQAMAARAEALGITAQTILSEAFRSYLLAIEARNFTAAARFLEMAGKHVDVQAFRTNIGVSGPDGGPIQVEDLSVLDDDELEAYGRIARKLAGRAANDREAA